MDCVQDRLGINASTLSHHLKTLVTAGLVAQTPAATSLMWRPNHDAMDELFSHLTRKYRPAPRRKAAWPDGQHSVNLRVVNLH